MSDRQPEPLEHAAADVTTRADLAHVLRQLRQREARGRGDSELTYRELAAKTGWSHATIGEYFTGRTLPPTHRFDVLIMLLGATPAEQGALATARDRIEDARRSAGDGSRASARRGDGRGPAVPHELPSDVAGFVGRDAQLAELDRLLVDPDREPAVVITALSGAGGVGKTALAVRWAHRIAARYPDGQLYVNLRGYAPDEPMSATDALSGFLRSLGVDGASIPSDPAERAARYRTLLAGRRVLVVLDNARDAEQVRPLLPGSPSCLTVVTSRDSLPGLVARDGARRVSLGALSPQESRSLLRTLIGARVDTDPEAAAELAIQCGQLPLALRLAAELSATNPDSPLADLVDNLRDEHRRLDVLDAGGDPHTAVRAVFSWSYRNLTPPAAEGFGLAGLHPGGDLDGYAMAALAGVDLPTAQRLLAELLRTHLVQQPQRLRFTMHDLLRAYAAEQATQRLTREASRAALTRLFDYYRRAASVAVTTVFLHHPPALHWHDRPAERELPQLHEPARALAWLDLERANLVAVSAYCANHGWPEHTVDLSQILHPYLDSQYYADALTIHRHAASVAGAPGRARAGVLTTLGLTCWELGQTGEALAYLQEAVANHQAATEGGTGGESEPDRTIAERVTRSALGFILDSMGQLQDALAHNLAALAIAEASGDVGAIAKQLGNVGYALWRLERNAEAADHYQRAATTAGEAGLRQVEATSIYGLGVVFASLGRLTEALTHLDGALSVFREFAERQKESAVREAMGGVLRRLGRYQEAVSELERAIAIGEEIGDRRVRAQALNSLGETLRAMGYPALARARHEQAMVVARELADQPEQDRALAGLETED